MKKKLLISVGLPLLLTFFASYLINQPQNWMNSAWQTMDETTADDSLYQLDFKLSKAPMGSMNTYLPIYKNYEKEIAAYYIGLFGFDLSAIQETQDYFFVFDQEKKMTVDKFDNHIYYESYAPELSTTVIVTEEEALQAAIHFIESNFLFISYDEATVDFAHGFYNVRFIGRIGNIKSYAFNSRIVLDPSGHVRIMAYYNNAFEKFTSCKIKSMEQAFQELPLDFPDQTKIRLQICELVYIYEDSFIQPAYLFQGELWDAEESQTKIFQSFVKAAIYQ